MIVLGPMDADLCGAPLYWRKGNWRPPGPGADAAGFQGLGLMPTIPFDRCDAVLVYDARDEERPLPRDQGWDEKSSGPAPRPEPALGTLFIEAGEGEVLGFLGRDEGKLGSLPSHAVLTAVFTRDGPAERAPPEATGFEAMVAASGEREREQARGMALSWQDAFVYRALDRPQIFAIDAAVPHDTLTDAWHGAALDGQLAGIKVDRDTVDDDRIAADDGGRTINSLDSLINNEPRHVFGYGEAPGRPTLMAHFGKLQERGTYRGRVRRVVASAPGRFVRAEFRAAALASRVRLRLVLYAESAPDRSQTEGSAAFRIAYASGPDVRPNGLPRNSVRVSRQFSAASVGRIVEVGVDITRLRPGEPLWFALERDWRSEADTLRATVHLLQVILDVPR